MVSVQFNESRIPDLFYIFLMCDIKYLKYLKLVSRYLGEPPNKTVSSTISKAYPFGTGSVQFAYHLVMVM